MKLAAVEGAGFGLGGIVTIVPDLGILSAITMRTIQKLSLVYGFEMNTDDEIACVREATRIAELGFRRLVEIAKSGVSEDDLAVELKWHSRTLGAEDNFLLLCAGSHNRAVAPSTGE